MSRAFRHSPGSMRQVFLTLAVLAVALKIMIPPGFMAAAPSNALPFAVVLCTGQGAVTIEAGQTLPGHDERGKAPGKTTHDSPCVFAGHGLGAAPPLLQDAGQAQFAAYRPVAPASRPGLVPGRGLSGPPLPARGPPSLLI